MRVQVSALNSGPPAVIRLQNRPVGERGAAVYAAVDSMGCQLEDSRRHGHRHNLMSLMCREEILATVAESQVVLIAGETGCGKTTQVRACCASPPLPAGCSAPLALLTALNQRLSLTSGERNWKDKWSHSTLPEYVVPAGAAAAAGRGLGR